MSRVTIGETLDELISLEEKMRMRSLGAKGNQVITIEIVPRKIVEDIISLCSDLADLSFNSGNKGENASLHNYLNGQVEAYENIKAYAEMKMREFEEGKEGE